MGCGASQPTEHTSVPPPSVAPQGSTHGSSVENVVIATEALETSERTNHADTLQLESTGADPSHPSKGSGVDDYDVESGIDVDLTAGTQMRSMQSVRPRPCLLPLPPPLPPHLQCNNNGDHLSMDKDQGVDELDNFKGVSDDEAENCENDRTIDHNNVSSPFLAVNYVCRRFPPQFFVAPP